MSTTAVFQRHERGQAADFVEIDVVVKPQAALHRAARVVVLHAVADVGGEVAVVQLDRDLDLDLALRHGEHPPHAVGEIELIGRAVEVVKSGLVGIHGEE